MRLCDALRDAFPGLVEEEPEDIEDVLEDWPSIGELAEWFSGSSSKRSREYRAARRRFERYREGSRRPDEETMEYLRERLEERRQEVYAEPASVTIEGLVQVSQDIRRRRISGDIDGDCVARIVELLRDDLCDEAEQAFEECFGSENMGGQVPRWHEVDELYT